MEKLNQGELVAPYVPPTSLTSLGTSLHPSPSNPVIAFAQSRSSSGRSLTSGLPTQQGMGLSDPKRVCLDQGKEGWALIRNCVVNDVSIIMVRSSIFMVRGR